MLRHADDHLVCLSLNVTAHAHWFKAIQASAYCRSCELRLVYSLRISLLTNYAIHPQQILDLRSYPDKNLLLRYLEIWFTDNYARKAWRLVVEHHKPDAVFFLGDLLDSGVEGESLSKVAHSRNLMLICAVSVTDRDE